MKKRITLAATYPEIRIVELQCDGSHQHQNIRGSVKTLQGWRNRAALSSKYPSLLGIAWGYAISLVVSRKAAHAADWVDFRVRARAAAYYAESSGGGESPSATSGAAGDGGGVAVPAPTETVLAAKSTGLPAEVPGGLPCIAVISARSRLEQVDGQAPPRRLFRPGNAPKPIPLLEGRGPGIEPKVLRRIQGLMLSEGRSGPRARSEAL